MFATRRFAPNKRIDAVARRIIGYATGQTGGSMESGKDWGRSSCGTHSYTRAQVAQAAQRGIHLMAPTSPIVTSLVWSPSVGPMYGPTAPLPTDAERNALWMGTQVRSPPRSIPMCRTEMVARNLPCPFVRQSQHRDTRIRMRATPRSSSRNQLICSRLWALVVH